MANGELYTVRGELVEPQATTAAHIQNRYQSSRTAEILSFIRSEAGCDRELRTDAYQPLRELRLGWIQHEGFRCARPCSNARICLSRKGRWRPRKTLGIALENRYIFGYRGFDPHTAHHDLGTK